MLILLHFILNPLCQQERPKLALHEQKPQKRLAIKKNRQAEEKESTNAQRSRSRLPLLTSPLQCKLAG